MRKAVVLMLGLGWSGCMDQPDSVQDPPHIVVSQSSCGESMQGRHMLGQPDTLTATLPGHNFASVQAASPNFSGVSVSVSGGELVASDRTGVLFSGASTSFIGMRLKFQSGDELEIRGVTKEDYGAS